MSLAVPLYVLFFLQYFLYFTSIFYQHAVFGIDIIYTINIFIQQTMYLQAVQILASNKWRMHKGLGFKSPLRDKKIQNKNCYFWPQNAPKCIWRRGPSELTSPYLARLSEEKWMEREVGKGGRWKEREGKGKGGGKWGGSLKLPLRNPAILRTLPTTDRRVPRRTTVCQYRYA